LLSSPLWKPGRRLGRACSISTSQETPGESLFQNQLCGNWGLSSAEKIIVFLVWRGLMRLEMKGSIQTVNCGHGRESSRFARCTRIWFL
jgi:hypothetical protein